MTTPHSVVPISTPPSEDPQAHEEQYVHAVYDKIASHFSSTRYKPWPIIAKFLDSLQPGSIGLDSGTGNGKYLPLPGVNLGVGLSVWMIGLDRSRNLLEIAKHAGAENDHKLCREVVCGDVLSGCWRPGVFDFAISIATIHHLSTHDRRKSAVKRLLQSVSPEHGRLLLYVWAIEQDELSKRNISLLASDTKDGQDVFVPYVISSQAPRKPRVRTKLQKDETVHNEDSAREQKRPAQVFDRYYHMFSNNELQRLVHEAAGDLGLVVGPKSHLTNMRGIEIIQEGWERSNYFVETRCWKT